MLPLNLPTFAVNIVERNGKQLIFDAIRRKFVALTPEEWVRQHFVNYLIVEKGFPQELLANEVSIKLNNTSKRCDTVAYNRFLKPVAIVEYKAPHVEITREVFDQIARYNLSLRVELLIVSNGRQHFCCKMEYSPPSYAFLEQIPSYHSLSDFI